MDKKKRTLIHTVVAYMLVSMLTLVVNSRKRKRRESISYEAEWTPNITHASTSYGQAQELAHMSNFRQELADQMWQDRENYMQQEDL
jgi:hypothetical protein